MKITRGLVIGEDLPKEDVRLMMVGGTEWYEIAIRNKVTSELVLKLYDMGFSYKEADELCELFTEYGVTSREAIAFLERSQKRVLK